MKKKVFRVNFLTSITTKILLLLAAAIATTGVIMISIYSPNVEQELTTLAQNYLHDLAMSYGTVLNDNIDISGKEKALSVENLTELFEGVGMEGQSSSYIYVVSPEGTMLFHPTPDKIGQPVENVVVKGVTADIKAGSWKENDVIEYEFKGAYKYASYYVNDKADYILVITVDSDELLSAIDAINSKGLTGLGMAFVFSVVVIGILVSIIVVSPILKIAELTGTVADMDFSENRIQRKLSRRKDEIGLMARSMGSLTESLSGVITNIHTSCNTLLASAETLQSGAERTTKSMQQVGSAVNDISQSANNQARDAQEATSNVVLIGDMIENTTCTVDTLMGSISEMNAANENAKEVIFALREISAESESYIDTIAKQTESTNESVLKISEATSLITDIASQTTLLSMNASIEAARAGEQGRGFAAVASEIKKLAVQSSESANTIIDIIQTLLSDSEKAMATMKKVREIIGRQTEYIATTGNAFEKIQKGVEETLCGMENISRKTSEMDGARRSVVGVVNNLSAIAEENAAATEQSAMSVSEVSAIVEDIASKSDELSSIAEHLEKQVSVFKL